MRTPRWFRLSRVLCATLVALVPAAAWGTGVAGVSGRVVHGDDEPVANATVFAYQVIERTFTKALTDDAGNFLFKDLPAGLYKIVAHKSGLPTAVLVLARRAAADSQFVQVALPEKTPSSGENFWDLRAEVPSDVLRDLAPGAIALATLTPQASARAHLNGQVVASAGVEQFGPDVVAPVASANLDVRSAVGKMQLEVAGHFKNLGGNPAAGSVNPVSPDVVGRAASFDVGLSGAATGEFGISGEDHQFSLGSARSAGPVDFARYQLRYAKDFGEVGSTSVHAQYVDESGLYAPSRFAPVALPASSRLWTIQGNYSRSLGESSQIKAGMRFRETSLDDLRFDASGRLRQFLDLWSQGQSELNSTLVLQYGLFTTLRDGSVSLLPKGGLVVRLAPEWQGSISASHRIVATKTDPLANDFAPIVLGDELACEDTDAACYEAEIAHGDDEDTGLHLRGSWREFDRTIRIFLRTDFLADGEGIFFVPGDQLPEIHASVSRKIGASFVTSLSSSYAEGGGGQFQALNRRTYHNDVTYLSTALDTTYKPTATGVYLAFHKVDQRLTPTRIGGRRLVSPAGDLQRVELVVSQDLSSLFDLASKWAVHVGMEVAKGNTLLAPATDPDHYRRSVTTGLAVRF